MKKLFSKSGWLVMAAALLTGMASCSSDEDTVQSTVEQKGSSIHVTVGAGIGNGDTRSLVSVDGTTRTLQFTTGDRLYVYGHIGYKMIGTWPDLIGKDLYIVGFLNLYEIKDNPTFADFEGDLYVYESSDSKLIPSSYDFGDANPLAENTGMTTTATLVHAAAVENVDYTIDENTKEITIIKNMAHDVNTLMTKNLWIRGNYTSSSSGFSLGIVDYQPIFECTITGAPAEELELTASYLSSPERNGVVFGKQSTDFTFTKPAGATSFDLAFVGIPYTGEYHRIQVASEKYGTTVINFGQTDTETVLPSTVIRVGNLPWLPNVINNTTGETISPTSSGLYEFSSDCNITVSGYSLGYRYVFNGTNNTINLSGLVATSNGWANCFDIESPNTTFNVTGVNTFTDPLYNTISIYVRTITSGGVVKLAGEGTLTVTSRNTSDCGILSTNYTTSNNSNTTTTELDVTDLLAAPGYNVVRSKRTDNPDGTYMWTYTVAPKNN